MARQNRTTKDNLAEKRGEYTAYRLWLRFLEKDEFLRARVSIVYFVEELLELGAIEAANKHGALNLKHIVPDKYRIKSKELIDEHLKKYWERPLGWQSFMAFKRRLLRRKSA